jgi:hypothetical protein|uniref:Uncharacterized protein n=1 Tax=Eutreptiella gymnastica TaxID=73025 RepID=A0A7S4G8J7_9EUGL|mmetsp:Transcript_64190/g.106152  ORF Transcript_64190/g.106152 Transcript_64190/m.106152 type:complete len:112 (+) Transcript_64190:120-455(+)
MEYGIRPSLPTFSAMQTASFLVSATPDCQHPMGEEESKRGWYKNGGELAPLPDMCQCQRHHRDHSLNLYTAGARVFVRSVSGLKILSQNNLVPTSKTKHSVILRKNSFRET